MKIHGDTLYEQYTGDGTPDSALTPEDLTLMADDFTDFGLQPSDDDTNDDTEEAE